MVKRSLNQKSQGNLKTKASNKPKQSKASSLKQKITKKIASTSPKQKNILNSGRILRQNDQKQTKSKAIKKSVQYRLKKALPIKKKAVLKKKVLKAPTERSRELEIKRQIRAEKIRVKEEKKMAKMIKEKLWDLTPNNKVPSLVINPLLEKPPQIKGYKHPNERKFDLKDCCIFCNNKEAVQCARYGDLEGLKACFANVENINNPFQGYSAGFGLNIFKEAVKRKDNAMMKIIINYQEKQDANPIQRVQLPPIKIETLQTGHANKFQFYFPIRKVKLSRGGKEGNNALTHDEGLREQEEDEDPDLKYDVSFFQHDPSVEMVKLIQTSYKNGEFLDHNRIKNEIGKIVRRGNFDLLRYILDKVLQNRGFGLNKTFTNATLQGQEAEAVKSINKMSLQRKANDSYCLLPGHFAAINPDTTMLKKMFKVYPSALQHDISQRDLTHYAAANSNPEALEFLISKKVEINNSKQRIYNADYFILGDKRGWNPLMIACSRGKIQNVKVILEEQEKQIQNLDSNDQDYREYKNFFTYVNTTGSRKNTPLHYASKKGDLQIVKALIQHGAEINVKNSSSDTPLDIACIIGNLDMVDYLISKGANIHGINRKNTSPFIKACINGHIHIVAYLLRQGVNPNFRDQSDNSALHYAAAYGWIHIVKLLIENGANPNVLNEWKTSPILAAMLKGHVGIVDYLIDLKDLNANFQDEQGKTLVSQLCSNFNDQTANNLKLLLSKKKIDCLIKDVDGFSPLHHLINNNIEEAAKEMFKAKFKKVLSQKIKKNQKQRVFLKTKIKGANCLNFYEDEAEHKEYQKCLEHLQQIHQKCCELLIKEGVSCTEQTQLGDMTPFFIAVLNKNYHLAEWLLKNDPNAIQGSTGTKEQNLLHLFSLNFYNYDHKLIQLLIKNNSKEMIEMAKKEDKEGYSPFLLYFKELNTLSITHNDANSEETNKYIKENIFPKAIKTLNEIIEIYANQLKYDITSQVGFTKDQKESLEEEYKDGNIEKDQLELLLSLKYTKSEIEKIPDIDQAKYASKKYLYDDISSFDPLKATLGLYKVILSKKDSSDSPQKHKSYKRSSPRKQLYGRKKQKKEKDEKRIDLDSYFNDDTQNTCIHTLIEIIQHLDVEQQSKVEDLLYNLLKQSKKFVNQKEDQRFQGFNKFDKNGLSVISSAIKSDQLFLVEIFIKSDIVDISLQDIDTSINSVHFLHYIKDKKTIDFVLKNIKKGSLEKSDNKGNTALHYAAYSRNEYLVSCLIKQGQSLINAKNNMGFTPLHMSLFSFSESKDHTPQIERDFIAAGANVNSQDEDGRTPIFYLFFKFQPFEEENGEKLDPANVVIDMLKNGKKISLNIQDKNLNTSLHYACMRGSTISALTLINNGAPTDKTNIFNNSPLAQAFLHKQADLCIFLIQNKCDVNQKIIIPSLKAQNNDDTKQTILPHHIYNKNFGLAKNYKNQKDFLNDQYDLKQVSAFYLSLKEGLGGIGYLLLSQNFDIYTALIGCLKANKYEKFIDQLKSAPKNIITRLDDKNRNFVLLLIKSLARQKDASIKQRGLEILKILTQQYGLNIMSRDNQGKNILHFITKHQNSDLLLDILPTLPASNRQLLFSQEDKKYQASPVISLLTPGFLQNKEDIDEFYGLVTLKNFNYSFLYLDSKNDENYIQQLQKEINGLPQQQFKTTILHQTLRNMSYESDIKKWQIIFEALEKLGVPINTIEQGTGMNILILATILNIEVIIKYLLGFELDNELKEYVIKSKPKIDINFQDNYGKTALQYAIKPSHFGTLNNLESVQNLLKVKANPLIKDKSGQNSFDYAIQAPTVYSLLIQYCPQGKPNKEQLKINDKKNIAPIKVKNNLENLEAIIREDEQAQNINIYEDADVYIKQILKEKQDKTMQVDEQSKDVVKVDENGKFENCQVVKDQELYYDVLMIKIDVKKHFYGVCNFYIMQIIFDKVKKMYILWTRWGRIGDIGQYQRTPFGTLEEAITEYKKIFRQKSGTKWDEIYDYKRVPLKYRVKKVSGKIIYQSEDQKKWAFSHQQVEHKNFLVDLNNQQQIKTKLNNNQLEFIKPLVNQALIFRKIRESKIEDHLLLEALFDREVLKPIKAILNKAAEIMIMKQKAQQQKDFDEYQKCEDLLFDLTNEYFEAICSKDYAFQKMKHFQHLKSITKEYDKIDLLYDIERITVLLLGAAYRSKKINPYDYCFNAMNTKLRQLSPEEDEFKLLVSYANSKSMGSVKQHSRFIKGGRYISSSQDTRVVRNIFSTEAQKKKGEGFQKVIFEEEEKTFKTLHNHYMLFHGTTNANVLSILEQGLKIQPKHSSAEHGSAFGVGLYFADQLSLAENYADKEESDDYYILVCEVALGNICNAIELQDSDNILPKGFNSLRIMSHQGPRFENSLVRNDGQIWPIGDIISYPQPIYKEGKEEFRAFNQFEQKQQKLANKDKKGDAKLQGKNSKQLTKRQFQQTNKKIPVLSQESDEDMEQIDTSSKKIAVKVKDQDQVEGENKQYVRAEDSDVKNYKLEAHVISYSNFEQEKFKIREQRYSLQQSQYVVFNHAQVQVRYVIHFKKVKSD